MERQTDRKFIEFLSERELVRGELFIPIEAARDRKPAILLTHGWAMTASGNLTDYALVFAQAGFVAMTIDFRNLGRSEGAVRQDINPYRQIEDIRNGITFLGQQVEVDAKRIGLWGSSFSGGHALVVSAVDRRVKCVVAQVPTVNGPQTARLNRTEDERSRDQELFENDRLSVLRGNAPGLIQTVSASRDVQAIYSGEDSFEYMTGDSLRAPLWRNESTLRSLEQARGYIPAAYISEISPTPLLMVISTNDTTCPTSLQIEAFRSAREPKKLHQIEGGHYTPYIDAFDESSSIACQWFLHNLESLPG